jgi:hypothetical protein
MTTKDFTRAPHRAAAAVPHTDTHCALSGVAVRIAARLALNRRPRVMAAALAAAEKSPGR